MLRNLKNYNSSESYTGPNLTTKGKKNIPSTFYWKHRNKFPNCSKTWHKDREKVEN